VWICFRILSLKTKDTSASSWQFDFVSYFLRYKNENRLCHHLAVCLTTGPKPLPKPALHTLRSRASCFKWEYPRLSLRPSSSFLRLLPRLPVTSFPPFIFHSITRCRGQFLRKMWPIQLAFCLLISCRIFLCFLTLSNTPSFVSLSLSLSLCLSPSHKYKHTHKHIYICVCVCVCVGRSIISLPE
jgi:hypothetical protein